MDTVNKVETLQELQDKYIFLDFDGGVAIAHII